ncbi:Gfo/Idh/MocA family protein [Pseudonocardia sp. TRM90224]|uniref:Gfo/Idh/MocA family protein n=1 Tax=Pseudonocardia sp. TRM90224 TaxID=2812678 RepID=UPI001E2D6A41|nr:Gfo/Idh/MocA family oxidoreductase [Pseudonocardia sp. TRM90224]
MDLMRVGLVGAGPWAHTVHGPALAAHPGVDLRGVWARRPDAAAELAATCLTSAYATLDELIGDVDTVAFAVPPSVQGELAVRAANAGKHVICEKPLAADLDGARAVEEAVRKAGVHSSVVLTLRYDDGVRSWLDGLDGPADATTVGSVRWLSGALLGGPYATSSWRAEHGALLDIGPHVLDMIDAALGPITRVAWAHYSEPDLWRFALDHEGGAQSTAVISVRLPVDPSEVEIAVFGPAGVQRLSQKVGDAVGCYSNLLDELVAAVAGTGPAPQLDAARGLRLQEIIDEIGSAAR